MTNLANTKDRAAIYVRVSTQRQAQKGLSLVEQEDRCREFVTTREWELVDIYSERGVSGRREDRPELDRLMRNLAQIDVLVIPKLDRLGRSNRHLLEQFGRLEAAGVELVSLADNLDTSTASGKLMRAIRSALAEFESDTIGERVAAVTRSRAERGRPSGGPAPYGYGYERGPDAKIIPGRPWILDPAEAEVVRRVFARYLAGDSQHAIARALTAEGAPTRRGEWHQGTVSAVLRNPSYRGIIRHRGEKFPGQHEPIVDAETWRRAAERREHLSKTKGGGRGRRPSGDFLFLNGALQCECGGAMVPRTSPNRRTAPYQVYRCLNRIRDPQSCDMPPASRRAVDQAAWSYFQRVGVDLEATRQQVAAAKDGELAHIRSLREQAERDAATAEQRLARVKRSFADGEINAADWQSFRDELEGERASADTQAEALRTREVEVARWLGDADPEAETLRRLAEVRRLVVGEVAGTDLGALRAAFLRLFERFTLHRVSDAAPDFAADQGLQLEAGDLFLEPEPRPEVVVRFDQGLWPVFGLNRVGLDFANPDAEPVAGGGNGLTT